MSKLEELLALNNLDKDKELTDKERIEILEDAFAEFVMEVLSDD